jgi:hypothetical protein
MRIREDRSRSRGAGPAGDPTVGPGLIAEAGLAPRRKR